MTPHTAPSHLPPALQRPAFLTVEEAAAVLRIGRTAAYSLARRWEATEGREGLPVVRVGRLLRVPRHELERLAGGEIAPEAEASTEPTATPPDPPRRGRRPRSDHSEFQAPLFPDLS